MKADPNLLPTAAVRPDCHGQPQICRFLTTEGRSALVGYFRKRSPWHVAEDLAHDAFLKAWTRCRDLRDPSRARPWLFGIARNLLVDHYRRPAQASEPLSEASTEDEETAASNAAADSFRHEIADCLKRKLHLLPEEQRLVIEALLRGEKQVAIARRLGLPLSTVKTRVQRARRKIEDYANQQCEMRRDAFDRVIDCSPRSIACCA